MQIKRVDLYYEDNPYETEEVYIRITDDEISVYEVTFEKYPGDRYGLVHELDRENTKKLLQLLSNGRTLEPEDCFGPFCGKDAVRSFKAYCKTNSIEYKSFLLG